MNFTQEELDNEIWKDILGYDYKYQISNLGRLKRVTSFHKNKENTITVGSFDTRGYLRTNLTKDGKNIGKKLHRLVAEYFLEDYSEHLTINHINFKKEDNRVCNLEIMSVRDNVFDYIVKNVKPNSSSNFMGVSYHKDLEKWTTRVIYKGKRVSVGTYKTEQEAIKAIEDFNNGLDNLKIGKGAKEKLSEEERIELFSLLGKESKRSLAKRYNVSYTTIFNIIERWKNKLTI